MLSQRICVAFLLTVLVLCLGCKQGIPPERAQITLSSGNSMMFWSKERNAICLFRDGNWTHGSDRGSGTTAFFYFSQNKWFPFGDDLRITTDWTSKEYAYDPTTNVLLLLLYHENETRLWSDPGWKISKSTPDFGNGPGKISIIYNSNRNRFEYYDFYNCIPWHWEDEEWVPERDVCLTPPEKPFRISGDTFYDPKLDRLVSEIAASLTKSIIMSYKDGKWNLVSGLDHDAQSVSFAYDSKRETVLCLYQDADEAYQLCTVGERAVVKRDSRGAPKGVYDSLIAYRNQIAF